MTIKYHVYLDGEWTATYDSSIKDAEKLAKQAANQIGGSVVKEVDGIKFPLDDDKIQL